MSEYTQALTELVALPQRLDQRIARSQREVAAERDRREAKVQSYTEEHEAVLAQLERVLERARSQGVVLAASDAAGRDRLDEEIGAEPIEYARQLVARLEESLEHIVYTRDALAREEASLSEEERRRAAAERRRREEEELRRGEQWERARQGSVGLAIGLVVAAVAGAVAGALGSSALLVVPPLAAAIGLALALTVFSTLPALAARRAAGSPSPSPDAPARETRLGAVGYAAAALGLGGLGMLALALPGGAVAAVAVGAASFAVLGAATLATIWIVLPRSG